MFLLIPNRIKELKDAGRREVFKEAQAEIRKAREEAWRQALAEACAEGFAQGRQEGIKIGEREVYAEERKVIRTLLACQDRGEITLDQFHAILVEHYGDNESD